MSRMHRPERVIVLERSIYPGHSGFHGYISGAGTVPGAPADLPAAGSTASFDPPT